MFCFNSLVYLNIAQFLAQSMANIRNHDRLKINLLLIIVPHDIDPATYQLTRLLDDLAKYFEPLEFRSVEMEADTIYKLIGNKFLNRDGQSEIEHNLDFFRSSYLGFDVNLELPRVDNEYVHRLMTYIQEAENFRHCIIWTFDDNIEKLFSLEPISVQSTPLNVISFAFGNLINGNRFVSHLNDFQSDSGPQLRMITDITADLNHSLKQLVLRFNICQFANSNEPKPITKTIQFQFNYKSIGEVFIYTQTRDHVEIYFVYDSAPALFTENKSNYLTRWENCDHISPEIIGKCSTLKLKVKLSPSTDNYKMLIPALQAIFKINVFETCISITPIHEYLVNYNTLATTSCTNFPFEVKYALDCINSLSFAFADDLYINGRKDQDIEKLIETSLASGELDMIVEALHRLFDDYINVKVYNAYEHLVWLMNNIRGELYHGLGRKLRPNNFIRQIILTPLRTLFVPPTPIKSRFMVENVDPEKMIRVLVRDDDGFTIQGTGITWDESKESEFYELLGQPECRNFFLKEIIEKRLFKEDGLIASNHSFKFNSLSVSQLLSTGIILQAESS